MQVAAACCEYFPAAQAEQATTPPKLNRPAVQFAQLLLPVLAFNVPAGQIEQLVAAIFG
jgi:hypothetical protein